MRLPQAFVREKKYEKEVERLMQEPKKETIDLLLESCDEYLKEEEKYEYFTESYELGQELANRSNYNKKELEELSQKIIDKADYIGFYFSALVNKIIWEEKAITLYFAKELIGLGACLEKGIFVIKGNTASRTGFEMKGGKLYVHGNTGRWTGAYMEGGELIISRNAGADTGFAMKDGKIHVKGEIESIHNSCKGKIYHRGELIWPK